MNQSRSSTEPIPYGATNRARLLQVLKSLFIETELREICFELDVEYDDLPAVERAGKARELIGLLERDGRLPELLEVCAAKRPNFPWDEQAFWVAMDVGAEQAGGDSPYKGMAYFDEQDAHLFFGREALTADLLGRLNEYPFLAVVGASGSGKSSLVRAGLIPAMKGDRSLDEGLSLGITERSWRVVVLTPTDKPLRELATVLTGDAESAIAATRLIDDMLEDSRSLDLFLHKATREAPSESDLLLVVDQLEELFTLCRDEAQRLAFVDNLITAAIPESGGSISLVITLRADFYASCSQYDNLRKALERHQKYIGPMNRAELQRAIEEPAKPHWEFEPGLVDLILRDVGATEDGVPEPGALPLLSHALLETWRRRRENTLTFSGYVTAGGVYGAIAETAEREYEHLSPEQRLIARNIFLRLTELGEGTEDTRRRASLDELVLEPRQKETVGQVLQTLADARLISTGRDSVEVAHEALIREWPTLRRWLSEDRQGLQIQRRLTEATADWMASDKNKSFLYQGLRLDEAEAWAESESATPSADEMGFLQASLAARRQNRLKRITIIGAAFVFFVGVALLFAFTQASAAERQREIAATAEAEAERATAAERLANARLLAALGEAEFENDPLSGLALVLEGLALAKTDESGEVDLALANSISEVSQRGRLLKWGDDVEELRAVPDRAAMIVDRNSGPGEVRSMADGALLAELSGEVRGVEFSPGEAASLFVADYVDAGDEVVPSEVRRTGDGALLAELSGAVDGVEFSPDGAASMFVVGYADAVDEVVPGEVRSTADGALLAELSGAVDGVEFSPDKRASLFVVDYLDGKGEVRRTADGALLAELSREVDGVEFSPDEAASLFVVDYVDGQGEVRSTADGTMLAELSGEVDGVEFSPDEAASLLVVDYVDAPGEVRSTADGALLAELSGEVYLVEFSPDEAASLFVLYYVDAPGEVRSTADGAMLAELLGLVSFIEFSPDEAASLFVVDYIGAHDEVRSTADGAMLAELSGEVRGVEFSPNQAASLFVVDYVDAPGEVRSTADGALLAELAGQVDGVQFSPDQAASLFVADYFDGQGEVRSAADGALLAELSG